MKILVLTAELPYPPNHGGGRLRQYELLSRISTQNKIHLLSFQESEQDLQYAKEAEDLFASVSIVKRLPQKPHWILDRVRPHFRRHYDSTELKVLLNEKRNQLKPDLVYVTPGYMAFYGKELSGTPMWLDATDSLTLGASAKAKSAKSSVKGLKFTYRKFQLKQYEQDNYRTFEGISTVSERDAEVLRSFLSPEKVNVIENGVDLEAFSPDPNSVREPGKLIFTGRMDYSPNVDAVKWFCSEILPLIQKEIKEVHFEIVGRDPTPEVMELNQLSGVKVSGFVEDLASEVRKSSIFVCPIRLGSGMKNKILEAMALGMPIVSTSEGASGLHVKDGQELLLRDNPKSFAQAVINLLKESSESERMGAKAHNYIKSHHNWESWTNKLEDHFHNLVNHARQ
ncbi:MAG: glycosyltransferase [Opitutales bacterium]|nr:glycosyltransferase [Opitutales bacterium]